MLCILITKYIILLLTYEGHGMSSEAVGCVWLSAVSEVGKVSKNSFGEE